MLKLLVRSIVAVVMVLTWTSISPARELSFEDRVEAQTAIEQVYWKHRLWPMENPYAKPALFEVVPHGAIHAKVEDHLRQSNALAAIWDRPITAAQLQAELDRMAADTRAPRVLEELFAALGNDPFVIAETLVRPVLVDRRIREAYAHDERLHAELRARVLAALATCEDVACLESFGGTYRETTWSLRDDRSPEARARGQGNRRIRVGPDEWEGLRARWSARGSSSSEALPRGAFGPLEDRREALVVSAVLADREDEIVTAQVVWEKTPFDAWWARERAGHGLEVEEHGVEYTLARVAANECKDDVWEATSGQPAEARYAHTAVWTGTEMIVWGGYGYTGPENTGSRYDPATDSWVATSGSEAPAARYEHTAVWTGTEMIVWGGEGTDESRLNTGGRYNPAAQTWIATPTDVILEGRHNHTAVWTGTEMIVWGGCTLVGSKNDGSRYDPATDLWIPTSTGAGVPEPRAYHTAVWTGTEMIVWGGVCETYHDTGGRYEPTTDTWIPTSTGTDVPEPRHEHTAVWTGREMIVWGGKGLDAFLKSGGRYDPAADRWIPTSAGEGVPEARRAHTAVWTGNEMIVWGGASDRYANTGARYDVATDSWIPTSVDSEAPSARYDHTAVWTASEMIVWGGFGSTVLDSGGRYYPEGDRLGPEIDVQPQISGGQGYLWPPRHGYVEFAIADTGIVAHDASDVVRFEFSSCHSSQPEDSAGSGDGSTARDCVIDGQHVYLRAERDGTCVPMGRTYTMTVDAIDACGNVTRSDPFDVVVPHDARDLVGGTRYTADPRSHPSDARPGTNGTYGPGCEAQGRR